MSIELGSILDEAKKQTDDLNVKKLLEEIMEFEKSYPAFFKDPLNKILSSILEQDK